MKAPSQNEIDLSHIPRPILEGFLKAAEKNYYSSFAYPGIYMPTHFSSALGNSTWNLYYSSADKTLVTREYDHTVIKTAVYDLDCRDGVKSQAVVRTGNMKLLHEWKDELDISFRRDPEIIVTIKANNYLGPLAGWRHPVRR